MCKLQLRKVISLYVAFFLLFIATAGAADSLLINYQGHLTGSDGTPLTQDIQMTFTIYDAGGVSYWSETHPSVVVTNGRFSVILGSQSMLESTVFTEPELYLGINVGTDRDEILPRTLLTSVPGAARADKVQGDIVTEPGIFRLHPPDPCVPPDPCDPLGPAFEMVAGEDIRTFSIFSGIPPDDNRPAIKLKANNENKIDLYYPDADADEGVVQMGASVDKGSFIEVHSTVPVTMTRVMMGGSTADTGFVRLFGGPNDMEYKLLEMTSHTNTGGAIKFFDTENIDGRELLTINCSPPTRGEYGWEIAGFNPQPEPPGIPALELGMDFNGGTPENYFRLNNPLTEYLDEPLMEMTADLTEGAQFKIFELAPDAASPSRELLSMGNNGPSEGVAIYGFNPQPEPPGMVGIEILTQGSTRGPGGGRVAVYDTENASVELSGGLMQVGHKDDVNYPNGTMEVTAVTSQLILTAEASAGDPPVITMFAGPDGAKVGIGTTIMPEALCVVGNIALTGNVVALTDTKLKTNIAPIDNALETIGALSGVSYDWRQDADSKLRLTRQRQIGLLAHEVEAVLPELVSQDADGNRMVAYNKLTAVLIEAIKELKTENESLKKRLEMIEKRLK